MGVGNAQGSRAPFHSTRSPREIEHAGATWADFCRPDVPEQDTRCIRGHGQRMCWHCKLQASHIAVALSEAKSASATAWRPCACRSSEFIISTPVTLRGRGAGASQADGHSFRRVAWHSKSGIQTGIQHFISEQRHPSGDRLVRPQPRRRRAGKFHCRSNQSRPR